MKKFELNGRIVIAGSLQEAARKIVRGMGLASSAHRIHASSEDKAITRALDNTAEELKGYASKRVPGGYTLSVKGSDPYYRVVWAEKGSDKVALFNVSVSVKEADGDKKLTLTIGEVSPKAGGEMAGHVLSSKVGWLSELGSKFQVIPSEADAVVDATERAFRKAGVTASARRAKAAAGIVKGDFVSYNTDGDGKDYSGYVPEYVWAKVIDVNQDGTLTLATYDYEFKDEIGSVDPARCRKLPHFGGMKNESSYYTGGKYNVYAGYYEYFITKKKLGSPYVFCGTIDSLDEYDEVGCYNDEVVHVDVDLEGEWNDAAEPMFVDLSDKVTASAARRAKASARRAQASGEAKPYDLTKDQVAKAQAKFNEFFNFLKSNGMRLNYNYDMGEFFVSSRTLVGNKGKNIGDDWERVATEGYIEPPKGEFPWFAGRSEPLMYNEDKNVGSYGDKVESSAHRLDTRRKATAGSATASARRVRSAASTAARHRTRAARP